MWSQNWQLYQQLMLPFEDGDVDIKMKHLNWSNIDMVKRADDFYRSLSLPAMTDEFWKRSIFEKNGNFSNCHGTAANMFQPNDYRFVLAFSRANHMQISVFPSIHRMILCAETSLEDFYVIIHEMGHLQYYMAFANQPTIYQVTVVILKCQIVNIK